MHFLCINKFDFVCLEQRGFHNGNTMMDKNTNKCNKATDNKINNEMFDKAGKRLARKDRSDDDRSASNRRRRFDKTNKSTVEKDTNKDTACKYFRGVHAKMGLAEAPEFNRAVLIVKGLGMESELKPENILDVNMLLNMDMFAIGKGLGVEPKWSPQDTLDVQKLLNRNMLANRERGELKRNKAVPIGKGLGVESKSNPEDTLNDHRLLREEGPIPRGFFLSRARGRRPSPSP